MTKMTFLTKLKSLLFVDQDKVRKETFYAYYRAGYWDGAVDNARWKSTTQQCKKRFDKLTKLIKE